MSKQSGRCTARGSGTTGSGGAGYFDHPIEDWEVHPDFEIPDNRLTRRFLKKKARKANKQAGTTS